MPIINTILSITDRADRIGDRWPGMTPTERLLIIDIADDIRQHAQRHREELVAVLATEPKTDGPPIDRPAWRKDSKTAVQSIYDYMLAHDDEWIAMLDVAAALGLPYDKIKYSFSQMKRRCYIVRGPDRPRPNGGSGIHQYRLARKEPEKEMVAA